MAGDVVLEETGDKQNAEQRLLQLRDGFKDALAALA